MEIRDLLQFLQHFPNKLASVHQLLQFWCNSQHFILIAVQFRCSLEPFNRRNQRLNLLCRLRLHGREQVTVHIESRAGF